MGGRARPGEGDRLPMFELPDAAGTTVRTRFFLGRAATAVLLVGDGSDREWIAAGAGVQEELRTWGAATLWVVAGEREAAARLEAAGARGPILLDGDGAVHRRLGAADEGGRPRPALLLGDRVGEIRCRIDRAAGAAVGLEPAVEWARYLGILEPECGTCGLAWGEEYLREPALGSTVEEGDADDEPA